MNTLQDMFVEHLKASYKAIKINGIDKTAFFKEIDESSGEDMKYMFVNVGNCKQGDIVEYSGYNWLVISQGISFNGVYEKVIIKKCQYNVNFIISGILKSVPALFENRVMDIDTNQYISLPVNTQKVTVQLTDFTKQLSVNNRFINTGRAWKVTGVDRTKDGLITLTCDIDSTASDDDLINEIPNKSSYTLSITNTALEVNAGESLQITSEFKQGNTVLTGVSFAYMVDNSSIATISETGLLTGISEGTVNVSVSVIENPYYTATQAFIVNVLNVTPTYEIVPADGNILQGDIASYTCNKYVGGVLTSTTWSIQNITGTAVPSSGYYTFTVTGANTFSVENLKRYVGGNVTIRCTDAENTDTTSNYIDMVITLQGAY